MIEWRAMSNAAGLKDLDFYIDHKMLAFAFVSRDAFQRLTDEAADSDRDITAIAIVGYQSVLYRGVPILWDESLSGYEMIKVENALLAAVSNQNE